MNKIKHAKKQPLTDWHKADIKAALEKAGWSLRKLSTSCGYSSPSTLRTALAKPYPVGEKHIARALGMHPKDIWPSRYDEFGLAKTSADYQQVQDISI